MFRSLLFAALLVSCSQKGSNDPHLLIETSQGDIEIEVYPQKAPKTVAAFLSYVDSGYYNNASFYRVLKTDQFSSPSNTGIIQGGIWQTKPQMKTNLPGIEHESTKTSGLTHVSGTVSLARLDPGTANTEFFICIGDQSPLDHGRRGTKDGEGFAAFGIVVRGMSIVRKIQDQKSKGDRFDIPITISRISRL
jgi:peptidyl-prolyl cis-trans isomerase A (cyclophilin A)